LVGEFADIDHLVPAQTDQQFRGETDYLIPGETDHPEQAENAVEATIFLWVNTYQLWPTLQSNEIDPGRTQTLYPANQ